MDKNSSSFFPLQQDEDFISTPCPEFTIWDVGVEDHISLHLKDNGKVIKAETANQKLLKKIMHKEIERQRRQEMASLCASLRSVLPPHYLKGKRGVSDQIDEAAKYIRSMQNNIRELEIKRDNMKGLKRKNESLDSEEGSSNKIFPVVVKVQTCSVGVETLVSCDSMAEVLNLPLSRILKLLLEEGLAVMSCNCTKDFQGRLHYMIQSEVLDYPADVNLQMLQRKLSCMINDCLIDIK